MLDVGEHLGGEVVGAGELAVAKQSAGEARVCVQPGLHVGVLWVERLSRIAMTCWPGGISALS